MDLRNMILELKGNMSIRGFCSEYELPFSSVQRFLAGDKRKLPVGLIERIAKNENCKFSLEDLIEANNQIAPIDKEIKKRHLDWRGYEKEESFAQILFDFFQRKYQGHFRKTVHREWVGKNHFITNDFELTFDDGFCWAFEYYLMPNRSEKYQQQGLLTSNLKFFIGGLAMRSFEGIDKISIVTDDKNLYQKLQENKYCFSKNVSVIYIEGWDIIEETIINKGISVLQLEKYDLNSITNKII